MVVADDSGLITYVNRHVEALLGWAPEALIGYPVTVLIPARLRDAHQVAFDRYVVSGESQLLARPLLVYALTSAGDETPIELVITGTTAAGTRHVVALLRERSAQVDLERHSRVVDALLELAAQGADDSVERFAQIVGESLEWDVAALWAPDAESILHARGFWHRPDLDASAFRADTEKVRLSPGVGLPGRTFRFGRPLWLADTSADQNFPRAAAAMQSHLKSAFAFPLRVGSRIVGVVELFSTRMRQPDDRLLSSMGVLGERLGELMVRSDAERDRRWLQGEQTRLLRVQDFLLEAARALANSDDFSDTLERLAGVAVPSLADLCLIDVIDDADHLERMIARHADPARQKLADELHRYPPDLEGSHPSVKAIHTRTSQISEQMSASFMAATTRDDRHLRIVEALEFTSYMCVPLLAGEEVLGTVTLVSAGSGRRFGQADLAIAEELASHAAAIIDRARHHEIGKQTVRTLQDAFIPRKLPAAENLEMAAAYLPAKDAAVGGDWYDVFPLQQGSCISIGDVAGHGLHSVAVMAQLRNAVRAYATDDSSPAGVMTRLNRMLCLLDPEETATAIVATWDPATRMLQRANAGHPPILRCRPGEFGFLPESTPGMLLGADPTASYANEPKLLRPGTTLVFYTDGLIENRDEPITQTMDRLLHFTEQLTDLSPTAVCQHILDWRLEYGRLVDDTCLLAVRLS